MCGGVSFGGEKVEWKMNRRDFFKLAGLGLAGLIAPQWAERQEEMQIGDLLAKIGRGEQLTQEEQGRIRLWGNNVDANNSFVAGLQNGRSDLYANTLKSNEDSFKLIYLFKPRETTVSSFDVVIPTNYNHLWIMAAGKTTDTTPQYVSAVFNDDTGANYSRQLMQRSDTTQSGGQALGINSALLGFFLNEDLGANFGSGFTSFIPNYGSDQYKTVTTIGNYRNVSFRYAMQQSAFWDSVQPIRKITFQCATGNFTNDSAISVYGIL